MSAEPQSREVAVNVLPCRVWEKGAGDPLVYLPGIGGLPRWTGLLDMLAARRRVIAPSLPGFPGGRGHDQLDTHFDWLLATHDLLHAAGVAGADAMAMAVSVSGALLADVAAVWPKDVGRLILIAPFGLFDSDDPPTDVWAQRPGQLNSLMCVGRETYDNFVAQPVDADPTEWKVQQLRALEAAARYLFPLGNTGLESRLKRIRHDTLLIWGEHDQVMPLSYAEKFRQKLGGHSELHLVPNAGHLADLDQAAGVAKRIESFLNNA